MDKIGKKIQQLRAEHDKSAAELAEALGKKCPNRKQYVYDLEKGRIQKIDLKTLGAIASFFQVPISYFLNHVSDAGVNSNKQEMFVINKDNDNTDWKQKYYELLEECSKLKTLLMNSQLKDSKKI